MANEVENVKVLKSAKSVKRVRFSDDVKRVDIGGESDDSGSILVENDSKITSVTIAESPSEFDEEPLVNYPDHTDNYSNISATSVPDDNNNNELLTSPQNITGPYRSIVVDSDSSGNVCSEQESESYTYEKAAEITDGYYVETPDLIELINETKLMTISPSIPSKPVNESCVEEKTSEVLFSNLDGEFNNDEGLGFSGSNEVIDPKISTVPAEDMLPLSSSVTNVEKIENQDSIRDMKQKKGISNICRKRSLEGVLVEKQTSKLNSCLRKSSSEFSSADELKSAVFNAWNEIKKETFIIPDNSSIPDEKKSNVTSQKSVSSNQAYEMWKKSKTKSKKLSCKNSELTSQKLKSQKDLEESKMAFRAWKKKKDEILRHQMAEKYRKEEKERSDSLMNERIRKNDADSAFSAWNAHKSISLKIEKKKNRWFLEKEKEKLHLKLKKSDEAAKKYHDWLRNKVYSADINKYQFFEDRPPWTPPGKGNNVI